MDYKKIISQLQDLKENSESFLDKNEPDSVWHRDIKALDEAMDIINDYSSLSLIFSFILPHTQLFHDLGDRAGPEQ